MSEANRHGLSRHIPADVKLAVRQACGFGCVVCGSAIIEYEHVDPPFAWATAHEAASIALLCPQCHSKVTRKFMNKSTVTEARKAPICLRRGFSSEAFDLGLQHPEIVIGGSVLRNVRTPLEIHQMPVLRVDAGEAPGAPFRLSGTFFNSRGELSLQIVENEWRPSADNWDFEASGGRITIRDEAKQISLRILLELPHRIVVEQLDVLLGGYRVIGSPQVLQVFAPGGGCMNIGGSLMSNVGTAFSLN
jgi:hypothetical protein